MKKQVITSLLILVGAVWYTFLFWKEQMGVNALLFGLFFVLSVHLAHPGIWVSRTVVMTAAGAVISALLVTWHNSLLAKAVHVLSLMLFIGFVQRRELRFIWYAFVLAAISLGTSLFNGFRETKEAMRDVEGARPVLRWGPLIALPIIFAGVFYVVYYFANPAFAAISDRLWNSIAKFFNWNLSIGQIFFFFSGLVLMGGLLWTSPLRQYFFDREAGKSFQLIRKRPGAGANLWFRSFIGLKKEYWTALIAMGLLNGLLLLVNLTDLRYVWLDFGQKSAPELSQYVHAGTWLLILSMLMAMGVILFFFRRNLNFFPHSGPLKLLTYLWIFQNVLLALSVGMRNYHYIANYGLAYKRLGVLLFLSLVVFGLFSVFQKVRLKKSNYYLFFWNMWAVYVALFLASTVNWDLVITRYNIAAEGPERIDVEFLVDDLSDKNLFLLFEYRQELSEKGKRPEPFISEWLGYKKEEFERRTGNLTWRSWNWSDYRNRRYLEGKKGE